MSDVDKLMEIRRRAATLIGRMMVTNDPEALRALSDEIRPRPGDFETVFDETLAARATDYYAPLWKQNPVPKPPPSRVSFTTYAAFGAQFRAEPLPDGFPGGYGRIARYLSAEHVWLAWQCTEPGRSLGTRFDGLVWLEDRFAWFPKPWRMIPSPAREH